MDTIERFLEDCGLERHANAIRAAGLNLDLFWLITYSDLEGAGIPFHDRLAILRAINEARPWQGIDSWVPDAEQRHITVVFCDLVDSTRLSQKLNPEALRGLMGSYQRACRSAVRRYGGHVAQYLGDGVMAYFGWPRSHEDDAENALRAAVALVAAARTVEGASEPLRVRIGVATGNVVLQEPSSSPPLALGGPPILASRLQALASADEIVIDAETHQLTEGRFRTVYAGDFSLKGIEPPVQVWKVFNVVDTRGQAWIPIAGQTPFCVGRDSEVEFLAMKWSLAKSGNGQVVLIQGEPGIGKSRLLEKFFDSASVPESQRVVYQCARTSSDSAFRPMVDQLLRAADIDSAHSDEVKLTRLERLLSIPVQQSAETLAIVASVLGISTERRYPPLAMGPTRYREAAIRALGDTAIRMTAGGAVLLMVEDAHWIDPSSLEVFEYLASRIAGKHVLLVLVCRMGFVPASFDLPDVSRLHVEPLPRESSLVLARTIAADRELSIELIEHILHRAEGVPLFLEELTKSVVELDGAIEPAAESGSAQGVPASNLPVTLRAVLATRLDRLSVGKEAAQVAACIGRQFGYDLLQSVLEVSRHSLDEMLTELIRSGLVRSVEGTGSSEYMFAHALIQEAAYDTMFESARVWFHGQIAKSLRRDVSSSAPARPDILAHHLVCAGSSAEAVRLLILAGKQALERMALLEAISLLQAARTLGCRLQNSDDVVRARLEIESLLGTTYTARLGWAATEVATHFSEALKISRQTSVPTSELWTALAGMFFNTLNRGQARDASRWAARLTDHATRSRSAELQCLARALNTASHFWSGNVAEAEQGIQWIRENYDPVVARSIVARLNHDPLTGQLVFRSHLLWMRGFPDQSEAAELETLSHRNVSMTLLHLTSLI